MDKGEKGRREAIPKLNVEKFYNLTAFEKECKRLFNSSNFLFQPTHARARKNRPSHNPHN